MKNKFVTILVCLCTCFGLFGQSEQDEKILRVAQKLTSESTDEIVIKKIGGGLSNDNYKVSIGYISYFFRTVKNPNSVLGSSLEREWYITNCASRGSIAPKVISYHHDDGILVTEFINAKKEQIELRDPAIMDAFCQTLSTLHNLKVEFPTIFDPYRNINNYVQSAMQLDIELPPELLYKVLPKIADFQKIDISSLNIVNVPAHLDLHSGNILDDGNQLWLIDWEYAAMADPYFDLATLTSVENFSISEMTTLLDCYLSRKATEIEFAHFLRMRIIANTRWSLWSYIQDKISILDAPYRINAGIYLEHALEKLNELNML